MARHSRRSRTRKSDTRRSRAASVPFLQVVLLRQFGRFRGDKRPGHMQVVRDLPYTHARAFPASSEHWPSAG